MLHWNLCKKYHLLASDKWWEHNIEKVLQNEEVNILWDFKIQTDKHLAHNLPDITVVEKKQMWLIEVAISGDCRINQKEVEKITKYQDLKVEVERLWEKKATVVPVMIGALEAILRDLVKHLKTLGLDKISLSQLQKAVLLHGNSSHPAKIPLRFLGPRRELELQGPKNTPVQDIWWTRE